MKLTDGSWKTFLARTLVFGAVVSLGVFVAVRAATARDGVAGGNTRDKLSFAGTLTGNGLTQGSMVTLTFRFHRPGSMATPPLCESRVPALIGANNSVAVEVPIDAETDGGPRCPTGMFDGSDVQFDVLVTPPSGGAATEVATNQSINPVPYARYADRVGTPDCPNGYERDPSRTDIVLCYRMVAFEGGAASVRDEVVRVGTGATAFWVDRFEASVYDRRGGPHGVMTNDTTYPGLQQNGQWDMSARRSLVAIAVPDVIPARNMTWFQARSLCHAAGKKLLSRDEWFEAADGLTAVDPTEGIDGNASGPGQSRCHTNGTAPRVTGRGSGCSSSWGVQDMIGNLAEWTDEWFAGAGVVSSESVALSGRPTWLSPLRDTWPRELGSDATWNVAAYTGSAGVPGTALRGGRWDEGTGAGVYNINLYGGPMNTGNYYGFRCVIPR